MEARVKGIFAHTTPNLKSEYKLAEGPCDALL